MAVAQAHCTQRRTSAKPCNAISPAPTEIIILSGQIGTPAGLLTLTSRKPHQLEAVTRASNHEGKDAGKENSTYSGSSTLAWVRPDHSR